MAHRSKSDVARTVAANFIESYGQQQFIKLIAMLTRVEPGPKIAAEFNVSRQRVHQWKSQLGAEQTTFTLDPAVENLLGGSSKSRKLV